MTAARDRFLAAAALAAALAAAAPGAPPTAIDLAGAWRVVLDPHDHGLAALAATPRAPARLPGTTDEAGRGEPAPERIGVLTRRHEYLGAAWWEREIDVPEAWAGAPLRVRLERVMWSSQVWVDGREAGPAQDSLCVPHLHRLGALAPGRHTLAVRIDNRMIHPIGNKNHAYGEQTQSRWNGAIGRIELLADLPGAVEIAAARAMPAADGRPACVDVDLALAMSAVPVALKFELANPEGGAILDSLYVAPTRHAGSHTFRLTCPIPPASWDEFTRKLYEVRVRTEVYGRPAGLAARRVGFRAIARDGNRLLLNGQPLFLRGNLDCVHFPLTGYPSTRVEDWRKIFASYLAHNLNHVRFHSWCPPEAAFAAADELGIYIHAEAPAWMDGWMAGPNARPEMDTEGHPQGLGRGDRTNDAFIRAEMRRIVDAYGDHPSFVLFTIGNELGTSDFAELERWIADLKAHDPRRLYAASTARTITPACDYNATHAIPGIGGCRQRLESGLNWDYEDVYRRAPVPIVAHEVGQWPVYPDWSRCDRFTGVLRNTRLESLREEARTNGVLADQPRLTRASGALSALLYKDEVESFLRTPSCRGFQLLSMQDFQGQGEAYVGWLDMFWQDKGTTDPAAFRGFCAPVATLARLPKYVFTDGETLEAAVVVRNDGPGPLQDAAVTARLLDARGRERARQNFVAPLIPKGAVVTAGVARLAIAAPQAQRLTLELSRTGAREPNRYDLWAYPATLADPPTPGLRVTERFDEAEAALAGGGRALLLAHRLGDAARQRRWAAWKPLYWSVPFFPGQNLETLGLAVDDTHPAFRDFPTREFNGWQWRRLCEGAQGFDLTGLVSPGFRPMAQPVSDFHLNRKLGSIFECRAGKGTLLVCGYDLAPARAAVFPEVRQLRYSLLRYAASPAFAPREILDLATLRALFRRVEEVRAAAPPGFENALLYVVAGGRLASEGNSPFLASQDEVKVNRGCTYAARGDGMWRDTAGTFWFGRTLRLSVKTPPGVRGALFVRFNDHNHNERRGRLTFEGRAANLGAHDQTREGFWVKLDVMREDTNDQRLVLEAECLAGPNLMIRDFAFVPAPD